MNIVSEGYTIAIDGLSSCGKSSFAKAIAGRLGYGYVDSGAMYRSVTLYALQQGWINAGGINTDALLSGLPGIGISFVWNRQKNSSDTFLNGECVEDKIRSLEVSSFVSNISAIPEVRYSMVRLQQTMGEKKNIVMDGRDIGTVVFPNADVKIFMIASPEVRAKRRWLELKENGQEVSMEEIIENIKTRDYLDQTRKESPLIKADDAITLDNSYMTPEDQMQWFLDIFKVISKNNFETVS